MRYESAENEFLSIDRSLVNVVSHNAKLCLILPLWANDRANPKRNSAYNPLDGHPSLKRQGLFSSWASRDGRTLSMNNNPSKTRNYSLLLFFFFSQPLGVH